MVDRRVSVIQLGRQANVLAAVVLGFALFGFIEGTRPVTGARALLPTGPSASATGPAVPGQSYRELRLRRFGPNRGPSSDLEPLRDALPSRIDFFAPRPEDRTIAIALRAERRAFDGAPPTVPHTIDEQGTSACLACHETGLVVQGRVAPAMSHEPHASCTQCHLPGVDRGRAPAVPSENHFVGLRSSGPGDRALDGAPPTMPHGAPMRERCASCHGVTGLPGLRTSHPERESCEQCHVAGLASPP